MKKELFYTLFTCIIIGCLPAQGMAPYDTLTISKDIEEVVIVQQRTSRIVRVESNRMVVDMAQLQDIPKFLGTSDPVRYIQSLASVQTNNETTAGIHIQGCDDYHTLTSINGAPIYYPNHLLGLYSAFIAPHFTSMTIEASGHDGTMPNRLGGLVDMRTQHVQPESFRMEGNIGLVSSDLTLAIPCGKKCGLWLSGRGAYINLLYKRWLRFNGVDVGYGFGDANLTFAYHPTDRDEVLLSGFFCMDNMRIQSDSTMDIGVHWYNAMGQAAWTHRFDNGQLRSAVSYSGFDNRIAAGLLQGDVKTRAGWASIDWKTRWDTDLRDDLRLSLSVDYDHYFSHPLGFEQEGISGIPASSLPPLGHADELSAGVNIAHSVKEWFDYEVGIHGSGYYSDRLYGGFDPRIAFHFHPSPTQEISLYGGVYSQYFHKVGLTGGGLPTDFFIPADSLFSPERAIAANLCYTGHFFKRKMTLQVEGYFKQLYGVVESTGNILQLLNDGMDYRKGLIRGDGRNYGVNLMVQKNTGVLTGYVSYGLGWARRKLPALDGSDKYQYAASHERRHDLNIVLNARFAKRWTIGAQFVLASGLPYTRAEEAYMLNGKMICRYSTFNGAHMKLYNRLDLSCSCDIINKKEHKLGINLSLYNAYCHKNQQFVIYRENLSPIYGTAISTIIPSVSLYGTF
ncbi:MAG: TonB-dependent receptor plug domain-containing protein [Paludibacteraceae bacterium]